MELVVLRSASMAERRTRKNKQVAQVNFYQPEISLPLGVIKVDLTKTLIVTILALLLQLGLFMYLQHGGWPIVLSKLQNLAILGRG